MGGLISETMLKRRLLVEGSDDENFCYHLFSANGIDTFRDKDRNMSSGVFIKNKEGIEKLLLTLSEEIEATDCRTLGILIDADEKLDAHWQSIVQTLWTSKYRNVPSEPAKEGTIIREEEKKTVGIWIMPNNQLPGMLEDFCRFLIPVDDDLWDFAVTTVDKVRERRSCRFKEAHIAKARIHTWLAWQEEPGKPLGQAITKKFFDSSAPQAQQFMNWIRNLFELH
jgi:hypothetical protein